MCDCVGYEQCTYGHRSGLSQRGTCLYHPQGLDRYLTFLCQQLIGELAEEKRRASGMGSPADPAFTGVLSSCFHAFGVVFPVNENLFVALAVLIYVFYCMFCPASCTCICRATCIFRLVNLASAMFARGVKLLQEAEVVAANNFGSESGSARVIAAINEVCDKQASDVILAFLRSDRIKQVIDAVRQNP